MNVAVRSPTKPQRVYESRSPNVGRRFLGEIDKALVVISASPQSWPFLWGGVRRHLIKQFPFGVLYHVYILAVMHSHRDPDYWKPRLLS